MTLLSKQLIFILGTAPNAELSACLPCTNSPLLPTLNIMPDCSCNKRSNSVYPIGLPEPKATVCQRPTDYYHRWEFIKENKKAIKQKLFLGRVLVFLTTFLVEFLFSYFLVFFYKFPPQLIGQGNWVSL